MNKKGIYIFRVILGGYLGYLGIDLLVQMSKEKPSNMIFMIVMGALFVVIGVVYAVFSLKRLFDLQKEEKSDESPIEPEDGDVYEEERTQRQINMQTVGSEQSSDDSPALEESTTPDAEEPVSVEKDQENDNEIENDYEEK